MNSLMFDIGVVFSGAILLILVVRPFVLKHFGAQQAYQLWFAVPFSLLVSLLPGEAKINLQVQNADVLFAEQHVFAEQVPHHNYLLMIYSAGVAFGILAVLLNTAATTRQYKKPGIEKLTGISDGEVVQIYLSDSISSPRLVGLINPSIYLPADFESRYSPYQQSAIIQHELFHYRRKDLMCNLFAILLVVANWFNPLSWLGYRAFRIDQEMSCDEAVTRDEPMANRKEYAKAVLASTAPTGVMTIQTLFGNKGNTKMMKKRINNIKHSANYSKTFTCFGFLVIALLAATQLQANTSTNNEVVQEKLASLMKPVVKVTPSYPVKAKKSGIEGWVVVEYGVTQKGTVENIRVIESHPQGVFDEAATQAIAKWRFVPHNLDGVLSTKTMKFSL